jgi:hypothetical protein
MDDIAIGRKEISKAMEMSWRSVVRHKKRDAGFSGLFFKYPGSGKPAIIVDEYKRYLINRAELINQAVIPLSSSQKPKAVRPFSHNGRHRDITAGPSKD